MSAESIFYDYKNSKINIYDTANYIFYNIMENVSILLTSSFSSIYEENFTIDDYLYNDMNVSINDTTKIKEILEQKFKDYGFIAKIIQDDYKLKLRVFLLEMTEKQYKEIKELKNYGKDLVSILEKMLVFWFLCAIFSCIIGIGLCGFGLISKDLLLSFCVILAILFLILLFILDYEEQKLFIIRQNKLSEYYSEQERVFCTEKSDINNLIELYKKYSSK